jgi:hypothetical protein
LASAESIDENRTINEAAAIATRSFDRVTRNLPQGEHKANIPEPQDGCFKTTDAVAGSAWVVLGLTSRSICPRRHQSCLSQRACGLRTEESFEVSKGEIGPQPQAFCDGFAGGVGVAAQEPDQAEQQPGSEMARIPATREVRVLASLFEIACLQQDRCMSEQPTREAIVLWA